MPIHDWSRVDDGLFHYFHQAWTIEISYCLNAGKLPPGYLALADQFAGGLIPDVVTLQQEETAAGLLGSDEGIAVATAPPKARYVTSVESDAYASRANRIVIQHRLGRVVAVIEIVSPGNKSGQHALRTFVEKAAQFLRNGIHLLVVDLFPPSPRDPQGIHKAIWDEFRDEPFELPADRPLTVASYCAGELKTAYVDPVAVGSVLPSSPIFLTPDTYVPAPLEETYQTTWEKCPRAMKEVVEQPES